MYIKNMSSEEKMDEINYTYFNALEKLGTNVDVLLPLLRSLETVKNEYAVESVVKGFSQNVAIINNMFYDRENGNEDLVAKSCLNILQKVFRVNIVYMSDIAINNIISTLSKFNFIDNWNLVPNVSLKPHEDIKEKDEKFNVNNVIKEIKGKSPNEIKKCIWSFLWKKVPCLTAMFIIGTLFLAGVAVYTGVKQIADVCKSCYEKIIVNKEGKEDTYIVNTESAKLYYEPSSHAAVVATLLYDDQVYKTEDVKNWIKIEYETSDGKLISGWIAKRNLMTYRTYQFHQEELYK